MQGRLLSLEESFRKSRWSKTRSREDLKRVLVAPHPSERSL